MPTLQESSKPLAPCSANWASLGTGSLCMAVGERAGLSFARAEGGRSYLCSSVM